MNVRTLRAMLERFEAAGYGEFEIALSDALAIVSVRVSLEERTVFLSDLSDEEDL
jgi:hypothetical protein